MKTKTYTYLPQKIDFFYKDYWVSRFKYPDKEPLYFGTLETDKDLQKDDLNSKMEEHMKQFLPEGFDILDVMWGYYPAK